MDKNRSEDKMKTLQKFSVTFLIVVLSLTLLCEHLAYSQQSEKRVLREFVSKDELVSIAQSTSFDRALTILSDVSKKYLGKIILDPVKRTTPIGVDIQGMHWQDAFEWVLRANNLWYMEYPDYFEITGAKGMATDATAKPSTKGMEKEPVNKNSREVRISAVFLNVDLNKLQESGINWKLFRSKPDDQFSSLTLDQQTIQKLADTVTFNAAIKGLDLTFGNLDAIVRIFSETNLGEVITSPQIIVRSSEKGKIQVGEDISVKKKDFAGNTVIELIPTGTIIEVIPYVIKEGDVEYVYLDLIVERSVVTSIGEAPTISRTKGQTAMLMLDGEEVVLGGLYSTFDQTVRSGLPVLKDLPWWVFGLRYIFGYDKVLAQKKELTILLKTEIVPTLEERLARKSKENPLEIQRQKIERDFERWKNKKD
jgi:type IV pilus assembly protein PilQ